MVVPDATGALAVVSTTLLCFAHDGAVSELGSRVLTAAVLCCGRCFCCQGPLPLPAVSILLPKFPKSNSAVRLGTSTQSWLATAAAPPPAAAGW